MGRVDKDAGRGRDAAARREAILEAAGRAFTARGFDGVGVREIAAAAVFGIVWIRSLARTFAKRVRRPS